MMGKTAVASDDRHPWRLVGLALACGTVYKLASGKKVDPLTPLGALATIAAFIADCGVRVLSRAGRRGGIRLKSAIPNLMTPTTR
jgi:hypothetical protein